jgi:hypothetical protein
MYSNKTDDHPSEKIGTEKTERKGGREGDLRSVVSAGSETRAEQRETSGQSFRRGRRPAPNRGRRPALNRGRPPVSRFGGVGDPRRTEVGDPRRTGVRNGSGTSTGANRGKWTNRCRCGGGQALLIAYHTGAFPGATPRRFHYLSQSPRGKGRLPFASSLSWPVAPRPWAGTFRVPAALP